MEIPPRFSKQPLNNPAGPNNVRREPPGVPRLLQNPKKITPLVFGVAAAAVLLFAVVWYIIGLPGAPAGVRRALGRLPEAGERTLPPSGDGLQFESQRRDVSLLAGLPCAEWKRRPIAVMLGSDPIARPLSGLAAADLVVEMPALVNNVTRLMAVYQCGHPREIGGVRSARHDFLFLTKGWDAVLGHWGGSYHALNRIRFELTPEGNRIYETIDAVWNTAAGAYYRVSRLPAPYNGYTTYDNLWGALQKNRYRTYATFEGYPHRAEAPKGQRGNGGTLDIGWPGSMRVRYTYQPDANGYERFWDGVRQLDGVDRQPVSPKVLVVLHANQRLAQGAGGYNDVDIEGSGAVEVYQNGQVIQGTWGKSTIHKQDPVHFKTTLGRPIEFIPGQLWIHVVDDRTPAVWTAGIGVPPELQTGDTPKDLGD